MQTLCKFTEVWRSVLIKQRKGDSRKFLQFSSPLLGRILALVLHGLLLALILHCVLGGLLSLVYRGALVALRYEVGLHPRLRRIITTRLCRHIGDKLRFPSTKASETLDEKRVGDSLRRREHTQVGWGRPIGKWHSARGVEST